MKMLLGALALVPALSAHPLQDARQAFRDLEQEYAQEVGRFEEELARLSGAEAAAYRDEWNPNPAFVETMLAHADEYAGTADALLFLDWVVNNEDLTEAGAIGDGSVRAVETLLADHGGEGFFQNTVRYAGFRMDKPHAIAFTSAVAERCEGEEKAEAVFARALARLGSDSRVSDEDRALCTADLDWAEEHLVEAQRGEVARARYELEHLQIGQVAPEIAGADTDGVAFELSDYRGKVVMIDFWGDW